MNAEKGLKVSIVGQWLAILLSSTIGIYEESYLPEVLQNYLKIKLENETTTTEAFVYGSGVGLLLLLLITSIAVLKGSSWARNAYLGLFLLSLIYFPFLGPTVETPIAGSLSVLGIAFQGITIGLLYFSEVGRKLETTAGD